jgi:hypothetical protein
LKRWAIKKRNEISLQNFNASERWIWKFKHQHRIVSRKITKFVTRNHSKERDDQILTANLFVNSTKLFLKNFTDDQIYNTDQSGFTKIVHSGRILEFKGARHAKRAVQSLSATTHSYIIQLSPIQRIFAWSRECGVCIS